MIKLTVGNSYSSVEGLSVNEHRELSKLLSYEVDPSIAYFSKAWTKERTLLSKKGEFPSGLLPPVLGYLEDLSGPYAVIDLRHLPAPTRSLFNLTSTLEPYPEQRDIVQACRTFNRGTISAVTGFGKSITMALLVQELQLKTLIVVPNLTLKRQLSDTFLGLFGSLDNIIIENIDSPELNKPAHYDVLIIDEAHHVAAKTYRKLNRKMWGGIYYRFFFTATPFRSKEEEQMLFESIAGQVIYEISYKEAEAKGYVAPVEAYYVELPKTKCNGTTWAQVYSQLVVHNEHRNDLIAALILSLYHEKIPTLTLVKEIAHGDALGKLTGAGFANGKDGYSESLLTFFNKGNITSLIGTVGVIGEGVDTKPAEYIILAGLGKSRNSIIQQIGRGIRKHPGKESCKVILFLDPSHKWSIAHFKAQVKIIKEVYGVVPVKAGTVVDDENN